MILETIRQVYPELTRSQKQLADFIAGSFREAAFMNASDLAATLDLNEATVIRFAQRLGYDGYPELVAAIRVLVQQELAAPVMSDGLEQDPFAASVSVALVSAQRSLSQVTAETVGRVLDILTNARRVYVLGEGPSHPVAQLFAEMLSATGKRALCPSVDPHALAAIVRESDADVAVIGVAIGDEPGALVASTLRLAALAAAHTVAVTSNPVSLCAQAAGIALICPQTAQHPVPLIAPAVVLVEALAHTLGARLSEDMREHRRMLVETSERIVSSMCQGS